MTTWWGDALDVVTARKDFTGRVLGDARLNQLGLHPARIAASEVCVATRRLPLRLRYGALPAAFRRDGVLVVERFLPDDVFARVQHEVRARVAEVAVAQPRPRRVGRGFGQKQPFDGGFDRFDGGTLNRFVAIDARTPHASRAVRAPRLSALGAMTAGALPRPQRFWIYETVHGDEDAAPDIQKELHRDTFHSTIKLWLFLEDVRPEDGPFEYVMGSHRPTVARLRWEHAQACARTSPTHPRRGGAFRIDEHELSRLGLGTPKPLPVPANTLVLADTRGFHRRGHAPAGASRLALYANLRTPPFSPIPLA
ncbi:MAG: phytanoyl-CoA dioxygenase family protein [Myxococcales bacterium]|nr:phytanoyl-CoA dioxygenase family protein [Myxococcales bacterium]